MNTGSIRLTLCHLYPDLLNLYGDRGNIIALQRRCEWRGIYLEVHAVSMGQRFEPEDFDMVFFGGGQDFEQNIILEDLIHLKGEGIRKAVEQNVVFLCVCGGYQMMGEYYTDVNGKKLDCLHALPIRTVAGEKRLIGDIFCYSEELAQVGKDPILIGFENHSGKTILGEGVKPLAQVRRGFGNNGSDGTEGARYKNIYCTYMHGSFLPKNPQMTDLIITEAIKMKTGEIIILEPLPDEYENNARNYLLTCKK
jgi:lipid II isoglutaminyl synthase (glutamine-hydrolysing)